MWRFASLSAALLKERSSSILVRPERGVLMSKNNPAGVLRGAA
jgi:hypothetical protein